MITFAALALFASASARASDATGYFVEKGHLFLQTTSGAPLEGPLKYAFSAGVTGDTSIISDVEGSAPNGFTISFSPDVGGYFALQPMDTLNNLNLLYSTGNYTINIESENDGSSSVQLSLPNPVFPTSIPHLSNFTAAQSINAAANFTLQWDAFADAGSNGYTQVQIQDGGSTIFNTTVQGNSAVIPAGTLANDTSYDVYLRFIKPVQTDTTSYSGAVGTAGFYNETQTTIATGSGSNGGGPDTQPPFLFFSSPPNNAVNVNVNSSIAFTFSEPMAAQEAIQWSSNLDANKFSYSWSANGQVLTATYLDALPANATIHWTLNPTAGGSANFRDLAGNLLPANIFSGVFTTGSLTNDPCSGGGNPGDLTRGFFDLSKSINFIQTNNAAPVLDTEEKAELMASFHAPTNFTATAVSLNAAAGASQNLEGDFGFFTLSQTFNSAAALDAAYPSGNYTFAASTSAGTKTATLPLENVGAMAIPHILNLEELFALNISNAFTLRFSAFANATDHDSIFIQITDTNGSVFMAPDPCHNIQLGPKDTSIVIPANTFKVGHSYQGSITFSHGSAFDTNSIVNSTGFASVQSSTRFGVNISGSDGGGAGSITWDSPLIQKDGSINLVAHGASGSSVVLESTSNFTAWTPLSTNSFANGQVSLKINAGTSPAQFFRARLQ